VRCPACQATDLRVVDSRELEDAVRRRRECSACGHRFTTFERIEHLACPRCGQAETRLLAVQQFPTLVRRQRECPQCGHRFTTAERAEEVPFLVVKRDGRREPFDRDKIRRGIRIACAKRPVSAEEMDVVVAEVESLLLAQGQPEVPSTHIGDLVIARLRRLDPVAYIRFASVYRGMENLAAIKQELDLLLAEESRREEPAVRR